MLRERLNETIVYLRNLNIYSLTDEDTNEVQQKQIIATRLFILLFLTSLIGLTGYTSLSLRTTHVEIGNPSQSKFEQLASQYANTLICPCAQTSIQINKFANFDVSYSSSNFSHLSNFH